MQHRGDLMKLVRLAPGSDFLCLSLFLYQSLHLSDQTIRRRILTATCLIKFVMKRCRLERQCGCFPDWVQCDNGRCIPCLLYTSDAADE